MDNIPEEPYFIKTTEQKCETLNTSQKYTLNRRGNEMFNENDIAGAARIFLTTGYSDGLTRVGDYYLKQGKKLEALKYYSLAHNQYKVEMLTKEIANLIRSLL
ncbi:MAG: hypothetical protein ACTTKH_01025 [Treponema sp.]